MGRDQARHPTRHRRLPDAGPGAPVLTVGDLLARELGSLGIRRVYGEPLAGLGHVPVADPDVSVLLADAEGRLGSGFGAALVPGGVLHLSSRPGGTTVPVRVSSAEEIVGTLGGLLGSHLPSTHALHLDVDLDAPVADPLPAEVSPDTTRAGRRYTLDPTFSTSRGVILVGPGVTRGGHGSEVVALARRTGWGVLNTWGAKGVLRWDDPFHAGTVGLQSRDWELAGLGDADLVVGSGLDPDEAPLGDLPTSRVLEVEPSQLGLLTRSWGDPPAGEEPPVPDRPALYRRLAEVVGPLQGATSGPLGAARAALALASHRPGGGLVVADADRAGFWLARAFPTTEAGSVLVPAHPTDGFAAAAAFVAALDGRPCVAVTTDPGPIGSAILEMASGRAIAPVVQVWVDDSPAVEVADYEVRCEGDFDPSRSLPGEVRVAVDWSAEGALVDAAGELPDWART